MSHFIFGSVMGNSGTPLGQITTTIVEAAAACDLSLATASEIRARPVLDMLIKHEAPSPTKVPYMLVEDRGADNADSLISPYHYGPAWEDSVRMKLLSVQRWVTSLCMAGFIERINMYMTEGYDERFATLTPSCSELAEVVLSALKRNQEVPSICLSIAGGCQSCAGD